MIGKKLKDRYDILEQIGSGGMATVYLAYCNYLKRNVAIKVLTNVPDDSEDMLSFEAKAIARVSHTNIVSVYDMFEEDGKTFIVMEYVKGATLKDYIQERAPLNDREIITLATKLASALNSAHTSGVIHRDIKPENIILDPNGEPKITDFGIAHVSNEGTIVRSDQIFGSLRYASPEQLKGNIVDERSDIYSLGVVLYEMATGKMPFPDESPVTAAFRKLKEPLPSVTVVNPRISPALDQIILRATSIDPAQRYHSMLEMFLALQKLNENGLSAPVAPATSYTKRPAVSKPKAPVKQTRRSEQRPARRESSNSLMPLWMGVLLGLIVSAIILVMNWGSAGSAQAEIKVPDVMNKTYLEAKDELNKLGLYGQISETIFHDSIAKGYVISQSVEPDKVAQHKDIVGLVISRGPEPLGMPDFINLTKEQAIARASGLPISLVFDEEHHATIPKGMVFEQSIVKEEQILPGSEVYLKLSTGPETKMVSVPNVINEPLNTANALLREADLGADFTQRHSDTVPEGRVITQTPISGTLVPEETVIDLVVSKGPEPKPEPVETKTEPPVVTPPAETTTEPTLDYRSMRVRVPYSDIPTDNFSVRIVFELNGKQTEARKIDDVKREDLDAYEDLVAIPMGATWYLYVNSNTSPTQTGIIQ